MPAITNRLDYFAMAAMQALLSKDDIEAGLVRTEQESGIDRKDILARLAYDIAESMETEAGNH